MKNQLMKNKNGFAALVIMAIIFVGVIGVGAYYLVSSGGASSSGAETTNNNKEKGSIGTRSSEQGSAETDSDLKNDVAKIASLINVYTANNNGKLPETRQEIQQFEQDYFDTDLKHPASGIPYTLIEGADAASYVEYKPGHTCSDQDELVDAESPRSFGVRVELTDGSYFCVSQ